jgi:tRNA nucleotidyltransferase (CCA-adding enzyme)
VRRAISHYFHRYRNVCTELKGRDLKAIGVPPGPIYRVILDELLDARLNGEVRSRQDEWAYLKSLHPELFKDVPEEFPAAAAASEAQGRSAI